METAVKKRNFKVSVSLSEPTLEKLRSLQKEIPAGELPDMIRFLMLRGIETIEAERARRIVPANQKAA
jgi:hypothetical protein